MFSCACSSSSHLALEEIGCVPLLEFLHILAFARVIKVIPTIKDVIDSWLKAEHKKSGYGRSLVVDICSRCFRVPYAKL